MFECTAFGVLKVSNITSTNRAGAWPESVLLLLGTFWTRDASRSGDGVDRVCVAANNITLVC